MNYVNRTGKTPSAVVNEAINLWMDTKGDVILQELRCRRKRCRTGKLIHFPVRQAQMAASG